MRYLIFGLPGPCGIALAISFGHRFGRAWDGWPESLWGDSRRQPSEALVIAEPVIAHMDQEAWLADEDFCSAAGRFNDTSHFGGFWWKKGLSTMWGPVDS